MKKILVVLLSLFLLFLLFFVYEVWQNNRKVEPVNRQQLEQAYQRVTQWVEDNYPLLQQNDNQMLWWMIKQASENTTQANLSRVYQTYKQTILDRKRRGPFSPLFYPHYRPYITDIASFARIDDYQLMFIYALSCDEKLGRHPLVTKQLEADFCSLHFIHTRCVTHQMMSLRFMQRYQCDMKDKVEKTLPQLQEKVISELTWDFRVTDAYIQRVTMLIDSGAIDKVKPVWIKRILDAQNPDGSWDDLYPLLTLPGDKQLALTSQLMAVESVQGDFHTTAQAVWLLSMLLQEK